MIKEILVGGHKIQAGDIINLDGHDCIVREAYSGGDGSHSIFFKNKAGAYLTAPAFQSFYVKREFPMTDSEKFEILAKALAERIIQQNYRGGIFSYIVDVCKNYTRCGSGEYNNGIIANALREIGEIE